jgi:hypothetical protein
MDFSPICKTVFHLLFAAAGTALSKSTDAAMFYP